MSEISRRSFVAGAAASVALTVGTSVALADAAGYAVQDFHQLHCSFLRAIPPYLGSSGLPASDFVETGIPLP